MSDEPADDLADELRALRARAYGPDADIGDDPRALSRLRELEARAGGTVSAGPPLAGPAVPGGRDEREGAASATRAPWWERHRALLWGGSLLVAALLGSAVVAAQQSPGREQVAVLREDGDGPWPEQMWGPRPPDGMTFEDYLGLTAIASARDFGNSTNSTCLWVFDSDSVNFGLSAGSCAAGRLPPSATVLVSSQAPPALRETFRDGTTLQFVLDGERVRVYAQRP